MVLQEFPTRFNHHVGGKFFILDVDYFLKGKKKKIKNSARVKLLSSFLK